MAEMDSTGFDCRRADRRAGWSKSDTAWPGGPRCPSSTQVRLVELVGDVT